MFRTAQAVTAAQMRKIWVSVKALGLSDEDVHQLARELTGKESLRALTCEEAARLIDRLVASGAEATRTPRPKEERHPPVPSNVIEIATEKQINLIGRLLWVLGWKIDDDYFRACVQKAIGRTTVRTKAEAGKVIGMLRYKVQENGLEEKVAPSHTRVRSAAASTHHAASQRASESPFTAEDLGLDGQDTDDEFPDFADKPLPPGWDSGQPLTTPWRGKSA
jgi:hypothetical protein